MSDLVRRVQLGHAAHHYAEDQFRRRFAGRHLICDRTIHLPGSGRLSVALTGWLTPHHPLPGEDPYLQCLRLLLNVSSKSVLTDPERLLGLSGLGTSRKIDLADIDGHSLWEVKPDTSGQRSKGRRQLREFRTLLENGDAGYQMIAGGPMRSPLWESVAAYGPTRWGYGSGWCPGPVPVPDPLGRGVVTLSFREDVRSPGLILWSEAGHDDSQLQPKPYALSAPQAEKIRERVVVAPTDPGTAMLVAQSLLRRIDGLAQEIMSAVARHPEITVVALGIAAAIAAPEILALAGAWELLGFALVRASGG